MLKFKYYLCLVAIKHDKSLLGFICFGSFGENTCLIYRFLRLAINMRPQEKQLLDKRLKDFMEEVIPVELFPYLPCLIPQDREEIEATQTNHGPIYATRILVDRLKRRDGGFANFVQALRKCGSAHTALLLDPYYMIKG